MGKAGVSRQTLGGPLGKLCPLQIFEKPVDRLTHARRTVGPERWCRRGSEEFGGRVPDGLKRGTRRSGTAGLLCQGVRGSLHLHRADRDLQLEHTGMGLRHARGKIRGVRHLDDVEGFDVASRPGKRVGSAGPGTASAAYRPTENRNCFALRRFRTKVLAARVAAKSGRDLHRGTFTERMGGGDQNQRDSPFQSEACLISAGAGPIHPFSARSRLILFTMALASAALTP